MSHGLITSRIAQTLAQEFKRQSFQVLCGHGSKAVDPLDKLGKIRAYQGPLYKADTILADLDIAVVASSSKNVIALIEIEETTIRPKVILGDALATLLGSAVRFQGKQDLCVGPWTTLIIMAYGPKREHRDRVTYLEQKINEWRVTLDSPNAQINKVVINAFQDESELEQNLRLNIDGAIENFKKQLELE
jgi:hypothetical protein